MHLIYAHVAVEVSSQWRKFFIIMNILIYNLYMNVKVVGWIYNYKWQANMFFFLILIFKLKYVHTWLQGYIWLILLMDYICIRRYKSRSLDKNVTAHILNCISMFNFSMKSKYELLDLYLMSKSLSGAVLLTVEKSRST
jgi:hypothetical protein